MKKTLTLNELGFRLRRLREVRGMTQKDFAEACGFNQAQMSGWEHGKNLPNLESILTICENLGLTVADFLDQKVPTMAPPRKPDKYEMALWILQEIGIEGFRLDQMRNVLLNRHGNSL